MSETRTGGKTLVQTDTAIAPKGKVTAKEASGTVVASHDYRISLYVCNPSSKEVWLALGATAAKEEGIWLKKESGSVIISDYTGIVTCCTTEGEGSISHVEV